MYYFVSYDISEIIGWSLITLYNLSLDIFEALLFIVWYSCLEQNGIGSKLCLSQGQIAVDKSKFVHAGVPLHEMLLVARQCLRASRATERPTRSDLIATGVIGWLGEVKYNCRVVGNLG